jgi:CRP/FNR family transcriptional regulator, cyclic AMP receptor protein
MSLSAENLQKVPLFKDLSSRDLKQLAGAMNERTYAAGREITTEGESGLGFFVVADGTATVTIDGQTRRQLGPGDHFGEMALIDGGMRSAQVTAETDLTCYGMTAWNFRPFLKDHPDLVWALLQTLVSRLREVERRQA